MATTSKRQRRQQAKQDRQEQRTRNQRRREVALINQLIQESGWAVCATDPAETDRCFAYTIGRSLEGKPELCTYAPDKELARDVLNLVAFSADHHGLVMEGDSVVKLGGAGYLLSAVPDEELRFLGHARSRYTFLRALMVKRVV